jgi:hypothetical protein
MIDLTSAQIHLAVNHLPVLGALLGTAVLAFAAATRHAGSRNLGFGVLVFAALFALPAYFSGEGAEEIVEDRPGVSETLIERHEEAAEQALAVTIAAGILGAAALLAVRTRHDRAVKGLFTAALLLSLASTAMMAQVAHLGGQIRHDEIRPQVASRDPRTSNSREVRLRQDDD